MRTRRRRRRQVRRRRRRRRQVKRRRHFGGERARSACARTQAPVAYKNCQAPQPRPRRRKTSGVPPRLAFVEDAFRCVTKDPGMEGLDARGVAKFMSAHVSDCNDTTCPIVGRSGGRRKTQVPHHHLHDVDKASSLLPPPFAPVRWCVPRGRRTA